MPAKAMKKKPSKKVTTKSSTKTTKKVMSSETRFGLPAHNHAEPFYNDPKNLMVIGAVMVLFLVVVMLLSGATGMKY